jgi:hypothetical protein
VDGRYCRLCCGAGILLWFVDHRSLRSKAIVRDDRPRSSEEQINSVDVLREEGRILQKVFAAPTGDLPNNEPDRWLEKVQLRLRSISKSYADGFDQIITEPQQYSGNRAHERGFVTLTQDVLVQLPYGTVTLPAGTRLEFVSSDSSEAHIRYMNTEQAIPIWAVDVR